MMTGAEKSVKVVVFSTNPSIHNAESFFIGANPSWLSQWNDTAKKHPELEITIVTALPGLFLLGTTSICESTTGEVSGNNTCDIQNRICKNIITATNLKVILLENSLPENAANKIAELSPDIAIAVSSWTLSYDWLPLNDSVTAHLLEKKGIKTVCNSAELSMNCFNKAMTHQLLEKHGFLMPEHIYVNHEMYKADLKKAGASLNSYREYILSKLSDMTFPVVIKPVAGVSSLGLRIADTFAMAKAFLDSRRNGADHLVEEYLPGTQMGLEIHGFQKENGTKGRYTVFPPMEFSLNNYGITNPRQSTKTGPVSAEKYPLDSLYKEMERLSDVLSFSGTLQIDLVYSHGNWYILELNSRLSGMTPSYAAAFGTTVPEMILQDAGVIQGEYKAMQNVVSVKIPVQIWEYVRVMEQKESNTYYVSATIFFFNSEAEQERVKGYFEIIRSGVETSLT